MTAGTAAPQAGVVQLGNFRQFVRRGRRHIAVEAHREWIGPGETCTDTFSGLLTEAEREVFTDCQSGEWRLEQERVPQDWVERRFDPTE